MMFAENSGMAVDKLASLLGGMGKVEPAAMKDLIENNKKFKVFEDEDDSCEGDDSSDNNEDCSDEFEDDEEDEDEEEDNDSDFKELEPVPNGVEEIDSEKKK